MGLNFSNEFIINKNFISHKYNGTKYEISETIFNEIRRTKINDI